MTAQAPNDGYIYISACDTTNSCGLYEAQIDGAGSFVAGTFQKLASVGSVAPVQLAAARHLMTGTTVLFSNEGTMMVDVWEQPAAGGALSLVKRVPVTSNGHYRAEFSPTEVVLNYLIRWGASAGSYTIPVTANGTTLVIGASKRISRISSGSELDWFPAANRWAINYRSALQKVLTRCWVTP